jgi:CHASE2 domain-containing sensor protein
VTVPAPGSPLRHRLLAGVMLTAGLLAVITYATGAFSALERQTVDARFHVRGVEAPDDQIVIVAVDDNTLRTVNAVPPIPRVHYARLLDRLGAAHPRLLAIDVQFIGKRAHPDEDRALLAAIARNGPVLVATPDSGRGSPPLPTRAARAPGAVLASAGVDTDPDGILRRMMYRQVALKTFSVRAAELLRGAPVTESGFPKNHAWIDFRGPPGTFPTHSMADVLDGRVPVGEFTGKVVLVGVTAPVVKDLFVTAASSVPMSGVEVHANALETILRGLPLRSVPGAVNVALILALAAIPGLLALRLSALYVLLTAVGVTVAWLAGVQIAFQSGEILAVLYPIFGLALAVAGVVAVDAFVERRQREALESALDGLLRPAHSAFFISYRREQAGFVANCLKAQLARRFGDASVFMDTQAIDAGEEWPRRVHEAILGCSVMLVLIGPAWLEQTDGDGARRLVDPDDWVRREIEAGLRRPEIAVVPILLDGARVPEPEQLPDSIRPLAHRNGVALTGDRLTAEIDELVDSIQAGRIRQLIHADGAGQPPEASPSRVVAREGVS